MSANIDQNVVPSATFPYEPLDDDGDSFRLLRLHAGDEGNPIQFDDFDAKLSGSKGEYIAASYEWGSRDDLQTIQVN